MAEHVFVAPLLSAKFMYHEFVTNDDDGSGMSPPSHERGLRMLLPMYIEIWEQQRRDRNKNDLALFDYMEIAIHTL